MSVDKLKAVHKELKFDEYRDQIKALGGPWSQLQNMVQKARTDATGLQAYKTFLARTIAQIEAEKSDTLTDREIDLACQAYIALYQSRTEELADVVKRRGGQSIEKWSEKWLPNEYRSYMNALDEVSESGPTKTRFARLMEATNTLFDAYASAVKGQRERTNN